jgi:hypothetical protein
MLFITVHPESVARSVVNSIDLLIAVGEAPAKVFEGFCGIAGCAAPAVDAGALPAGEAFVWRPLESAPSQRVKTAAPTSERRRHLRKYAEGNLGPDKSFHFRGPAGKLNLKAQNLSVFLQLADGVDDDTWTYHLGRGEYSTWFRDAIKDNVVADLIASIETTAGLPATESRRAVREAIESHYTLTADRASGIVAPTDRAKN